MDRTHPDSGHPLLQPKMLPGLLARLEAMADYWDGSSHPEHKQFRMTVDEAIAVIAAQEWVNTSERMPPQGKTVMVEGGMPGDVILCFVDSAGLWRHRDDCSWIPRPPRRWHPTPAP